MTKRNFLLINRKPQEFEKVLLGKKGIILQSTDGKVLDNGIMVLDDTVRAMLYCEEVRNLTFLVTKPGAYAIETLIFADEDHYKKVLQEIQQKFPRLERSPQNKKLNRYAERLMEKLRDGQDVRIVDAIKESDMIICPECGVQCAPGTPYCMECGAELPVK